MVSEDEAKEIINEHRNLSNDKPKTETDILGIGKLGDTLSSDKNLLQHSIINSDMPPKLGILYAFNHEVKSPLITTYLNTILGANVSVKGQGRKDILSLAKSISLAISGLRQEENGWRNPFKKNGDI